MISSAQDAERTKARILIVDDHPENLLALESILDDLDVDVVRANSGQEALKSILDDQFALVLLDIQMPEMDGYETASLIRTRERSRHTPIIFVTAIYTSDENVHRGYAVGATDYITKPLDGDMLKAKVASFVSMSENARALEEEIIRRKSAEDKYREISSHLDNLVKERTTELEETIANLTKSQSEVANLNVKLRRAMTETHHRIKNSLQVIAAIIDLQVMQDLPAIPVEQVQKLGINVRTLALVHNFLTEQSKQDNLASHANAGEVLESLLQLLQQTSPDRPLTVTSADITLGSHQLSSLALITSELVSNAIKYGTGAIHIELSTSEGEVTVVVQNEGGGFPSGFDPAVEGTTGLGLVQTLSEWDLRGRIGYGNTPAGACVTLSFPQNQPLP
jgi:two-component sensor histidine kinase